jgi:hypothetical protein
MVVEDGSLTYLYFAGHAVLLMHLLIFLLVLPFILHLISSMNSDQRIRTIIMITSSA